MDEIRTNLAQTQYQGILAYVVYTGGKDGDVLVTEHHITNGVVGSGSPISRKSLLDLCSIVMPTIKESPKFLGEDILGYSPTTDTLVWWKRPGTENLFFSQKDMKSGKAPLPGLIFEVEHGHMSMWALKVKTRPTLNTELYNAPFFNVRSSVCMGNTPLPGTATPENYLEWEKAFFNSSFSGDWTPPLKGIKGKALWQSLVDKDIKEFPVKYLSPIKDVDKKPITLASIFGCNYTT